MKIFKSFVVIFFLFTTLSNQAHGTRLSAEERALVLTFRMSKYLQLTELQKTEIMKIHQTSIETLDQAKLQFRENKEMLKKSIKKIYIEQNAELQKILTKEQFETYKLKQIAERDRIKKARKTMREQKCGDQPTTVPDQNPNVPKK